MRLGKFRRTVRERRKYLAYLEKAIRSARIAEAVGVSAFTVRS